MFIVQIIIVSAFNQLDSKQIICSKSTIETPEKCASYVPSKQQRHQNDVIVNFDIFIPFSSVSFVGFDQGNISWVDNGSFN